MQPVFGAKASPLVILHVYPTLTISLVGVSESVVRAMETMREHPELLSESLIFFPCLYRTYYHFLFRPVSVHAQVYERLGPSQVPYLTRLPDPERGLLPLCTLHHHR
jgi:hypothetical protein